MKEKEIRHKNLNCRVSNKEYNLIIDKVNKAKKLDNNINISDYIRDVLIKSTIVYIEDKTTKNYEQRKELLKEYMNMKSDLKRLGNIASMVQVNSIEVRTILEAYVKKLESIIREF